MDWTAIGAIGEVGGAIGVIATLAYLSVQIRSSSRATESEVHASLASEMQTLMVAASRDDQLNEAMLLSQSNEDLTALQALKLQCWFNGFLRVCESHFIQRELAATTIDLKTPIVNILRQFAQQNFYRNTMAQVVQDGAASPGFLSWLDTEVLKSGGASANE